MTNGFEPFVYTVDSPLYPRSFPAVFQAAIERLIAEGADPTLDEYTDLDQIVFKRCWSGDFDSVKALLEKLQELGGDSTSPPRRLLDE